jgi:pyruvate/2-oxoglutarate dehydrogenase complex dihydrolipoamide acyltransferase (E2) component
VWNEQYKRLTKVKMNRMRLRISERLKESQNIAASLTTFNEIDMRYSELISNLMNLRKKYKDLVMEKHGVKMGFMGAFMKASAAALMEVPAINGRIEGENIIFSDYVDISVAVSTPKGLVTPVLRNCENMSILELEKELASVGKKVFQRNSRQRTMQLLLKIWLVVHLQYLTAVSLDHYMELRLSTDHNLQFLVCMQSKTEQ